MSALAAAQTALAVHLNKHVAAEPIAAAVPAVPVAWGGYVWPATDWVTIADEPTYCGMSVGLVFDVVAGITDLAHSQAWLADRIAEVWDACSGGVDLGGDETIPERSFVVGIVRSAEGAELLVARTEFSRVTLG